MSDAGSATFNNHITASGNISASGNIKAETMTVVDTITAGGISGPLTTAAQPNITSLGTLTKFNVNGNITASGAISSSGKTILGVRKFEKTQAVAGNHQGDVVYFGEAESMTPGSIYYYKPDNTWALANATNSTTGTGLLGVALGTESLVDGVLIRGTVTLSADPGEVADTLFLSTTNGRATSTPASGSGNIIRVIGYCLDGSNSQVWFNPDGAFVEAS
jgi:hypothetical protein